MYVPPTDEALYEAARRVCEASAGRAGDPSLAEWAHVRGLADFLRAAAQLLADQMNGETDEIDKAG